MRVGQKNKLTYRWARKGSRPRAALDTTAEQEGPDPNKKGVGVGPLVHECGKGSIDLKASAGIDLHPHSYGLDSRFQFFQRGLGSPGIGRIDEHGNANRSR
jgi:hypothetical protein